MQPTQEYLHSVLRYDPHSGDLFWKKAVANRVRPGDLAGYVTNSGYRIITVHNRGWHAHRLVWLMHEGYLPDEVDHTNGNKLDNRLHNLRDVPRSTNMRNLPLYETNSSGLAGVRWDAGREKWRASIGGNPRVYLGQFDTLLDAAAARKSAEVSHGYHENHGRSAWPAS